MTFFLCYSTVIETFSSVFFFVICSLKMRNIQLLGVLLVIVGSFLPLVHIPIIGNWNYWQLDSRITMLSWVLWALALAGIAINNQKLIKGSGILLILLFIFTLIAIKFKSLDYFNFLVFDSFKELAAGIVKLKWGWFFEFGGALLMLFSKKSTN